MFLAVGVSELPGLIAIASTFVFGPSLWLILLGAAISLVALWRVAPPRRSLNQDQQRLLEQGSSLNLVAALNAPNPPSAP